MARLYQQFQDICLRESTEQDLRNDLKTVWENHSSARRLDINVKFILLHSVNILLTLSQNLLKTKPFLIYSACSPQVSTEVNTTTQTTKKIETEAQCASCCAGDIWENSVGSGENGGGGDGGLCIRFCGDMPLLRFVCEQKHMRVVHSQGAHMLHRRT